MKRIFVDFNTLNSAPVHLVKLASPEQAAELPPLCDDERVVLYDDDGLEVEAIVFHDEAGWWFGAPDGDTWRDTIPAQG